MIDQIIYYANMVMFVTMGVLFGLGLLLFYLLKIKKFGAKKERVDYSTFVRTDSTEYVKFQDVLEDDEGMYHNMGIIDMGNHCYVAGLSINGYNFASASAQEREQTMVNAITLFNIVENPIQLRQTVKAISLEHNMNQFKEISNNLAIELLELDEKMKKTIAIMEDYTDQPEIFENYEKELEKLNRLLMTKKHSLEEANMLVTYMDHLTGGEKRDMQKVNQVMFSWEFNPDESIEERDENGIRLMAFEELHTKSASLIEAFMRCGCSARRMTKKELIHLMYRHTHPASADDTTVEELLDNSDSAFAITSNSLVNAEIERVGELVYRQNVEEWTQREENAVDADIAEMDREGRVLLDFVQNQQRAEAM